MTRPILKARTLVTDDGVAIDAVHLPGDMSLAIVLAHGFTLNWQHGHVWKTANTLNHAAMGPGAPAGKGPGVIMFDFRGHGRSGGLSTCGDREVRDVEVAVGYARELGYQRVVTVGFSMGASVVLRHAALAGGVDAVVSVSGPGQWYYRGTRPMRLVHWAVLHRAGRLATRVLMNTRISPEGWPTVPLAPAEAAARIAPTPLLIVHGDADGYFPVDHARQLFAAAREPKELWIVPGFGHAESGATAAPALLDRIAGWIRAAVPLAASPNAVA
jgi:pimeloyl-ACP methyl ester carboxylesterase